jgi:transposase
MQLVPKKINGNTYWYLIRKGRKNGVPTNVETIYLGKPDRIASLLGLAKDPDSCDAFPVGSKCKEVGASAALWQEVVRLDLVKLIDEALAGEDKSRRSDAATSFGQLLVAAAIQRAIAPRALKSLAQLKNWFEGCGLQDHIRIPSAGLDVRRIEEAFSRLSSGDLQNLEARIVERAIKVHQISLEKLTFDATNFDSYAASGTRCPLLKRGNAKSKRKNLRILGLGMLVSADGGIPLLSFPYPGNKADATTFKSFLRRLKKCHDRVPIGEESTLAFDGGNISKEVVRRLDKASLQYVARLPRRHASDATAIPTGELPWLKGSLAGKVRAKKLRTKVYGVERTVVAVFSESMRTSQIPGIERDIRRAKDALAKLQDRLERQRIGARHKPLTVSQARVKALQAITREHLSKLFTVDITGEDCAPEFTYQYHQEVWEELHKNSLGRTLILTSRDRWASKRIVETLREQSYVEDAFRQMKDAEWAAATPLRHHTDRTLRVHAFVSVVALLLSTLMVRRLRKGGMSKATVSNVLYELSELKTAKLRYSSKAPARLRKLAKLYEIAPDPTSTQRKILGILRLKKSIILGTTRFNLKTAS